MTQLVLHGLGTTGVARRLHLSEYAVQDHLKAIFDNVGCAGRRELVAHLSSSTASPDSGRPSIGSTSWFLDRTSY